MKVRRSSSDPISAAELRAWAEEVAQNRQARRTQPRRPLAVPATGGSHDRCAVDGCTNRPVPPLLGMYRCFEHWCELEGYVPTHTVIRNGYPHVVAGHYLPEDKQRRNTNSESAPPDQQVYPAESRNGSCGTGTSFVLPPKGRGRPRYRLGDKCRRGHLIEGDTAIATAAGGWRCRIPFTASRRLARTSS